MIARPSWEELYISMCYLVGTRSRDLSTKVGCVITGQDNVIKSIGYNSFPRNIESEGELKEDGLPARQSRIDGEKYHWFEHAERNAIYNAGRNGVPLLNCILYITWLPCTDCARGIIQSGINHVVIHEAGQQAFIDSRGGNDTVWNAAHERSWLMMEEAGVNVRWYRGPVQDTLYGYFSGYFYEFTADRMSLVKDGKVNGEESSGHILDR